MRSRLNLAVAALFCVASIPARAAHTQARLVLAAETARPGETVQAGLHLHMDPGWHTYWRNSGQSGLPTTIEWQLPPGVTAGQIQWPLPKKAAEEELTTYVYEEDVVLLVALKLAPDLKPSPLTLKAKLDWLECEKKCVKEGGDVQATLNIGTEAKVSKDADLLASWRKKLPASSDGLSARAWWENPGAGDTRPMIVEWQSTQAPPEADFFPDSNEQFEVQPATEKLSSDAGTVRLRARVKKTGAVWPKEISGVLIQGSGDGRVGYEVNLAISEAVPKADSGRAAIATTSPQPLWKMLIFAFIGGLILNVMPCVLPVIALKILGFVREAQNEPARVRKLGLIYTAGVLSSFLTLALIVIALQAAGQSVGWGFQFTSPSFLIAMATLVTLVTLNLFGVFEVTLSSNALTAANALASKEGGAGTFFNGLLATVLATSCSAPIFAPAVGFAFTLKQPLITILILLTAGVGLAAPYLVLSWQPAWLKFLPKPGLWMNRFKVAMGFPMLAAIVWLYSLVGSHYGDRAWWVAVFLVFVALAAWIFGEFVQRGSKHRGIAALVSVVVLVGGYAFAMEKQLDWRQPRQASDDKGKPSQVSPSGLAWTKWSPEAVAAAQAAGHPVVVDFTAKWCPNCNIIIKPSLEDASVQSKLREVNAVLLVSDYSLSSKTLASDLAPFGRAAIPVVLVYSSKASEPPQVFDFLTAGTVLDALAQATR